MPQRPALVFLLAALAVPCDAAVSKTATKASVSSKSSFIPSQGLDVEKILVEGRAEPGSGKVPRAAAIEGNSLQQTRLARRMPAVEELHSKREVPPPPTEAEQPRMLTAFIPAPRDLPPTINGKKTFIAEDPVTTDSSAAGEAATVVTQDDMNTHIRAYGTAAFASGLTVGVVITLLLLSIGKDSFPSEKDRRSLTTQLPTATPDRSPETPEVSASTEAPSSNQPVADRNTDGFESIHRFGPRCSFLVGMLLVQSLSSLMLAGFQDLIRDHPSIIFFLTMVVGTGGNVGGQSVVLAVRRLAYGEEVSLSEQVAVGVQLSAVLAPLALLRAWAQGTAPAVCMVIGVATIIIVVSAAALGTALPKLLNRVKVDPAHATPVIQVLMDMVGVLVTCAIGYMVLDIWLKAEKLS